MRFAELCIDEIRAANSGRDAALRRAVGAARRPYHLRYAGWPSFTATNIPRQVAQIFPPALNVPSTVARSSVRSITFAERKTESFVGVGRSNLIKYSAVTVHGG